MMDDKVIEKISEALLNLEQRGEIVITSTVLPQLSQSIFHSALKGWITNAELLDDPIESTIPHLLALTVTQVDKIFSVGEAQAKCIVKAYYKEFLTTRSLKEVAEIFWHETPNEMAKRAFYHVELNKADDLGLDYLEWRKNY